MISDTKFAAISAVEQTVQCTKRGQTKVMRNRKAVLSAAVLFAVLAACAAFAQDQTSKVIPNSIWVGADGKFESDPDTALVQFNISAQQKTLQDASRQATQATDQVRQLLRTNGIDPSAAQISRFGTQPVYDYQNSKQKLIGYRVDAYISVKVMDFSKIGPISEGLSNMDAANTSITYQLDNIDAANAKAVQDAMRRAHEIANAAAQAGGRGLGDLSYVSVDTFEPQPVRPMMMKAQAAPGAMANASPTAEFSAEKITVTAHVNTLYSLK